MRPVSRSISLVDTEKIVAPEPAPKLVLAPPPARYPGAALVNRPPAKPVHDTGKPTMVDNRFTEKNSKLAAGFGVCGNAPLGDGQATAPLAIQQMQAAAPPERRASVEEAFGGLR